MVDKSITEVNSQSLVYNIQGEVFYLFMVLVAGIVYQFIFMEIVTAVLKVWKPHFITKDLEQRKDRFYIANRINEG